VEPPKTILAIKQVPIKMIPGKNPKCEGFCQRFRFRYIFCIPQMSDVSFSVDLDLNLDAHLDLDLDRDLDLDLDLDLNLDRNHRFP
jgi:hypothetical protein